MLNLVEHIGCKHFNLFKILYLAKVVFTKFLVVIAMFQNMTLVRGPR